MADNLAGRVALVTGAAQGIGRAVAEGLLAVEATVVVADIDIAGAHRTAAELGAGVTAVELDVADAAQVQRAVDRTEGLGGIDILVSNAGIFPRSRVADLDEREWDRVLAVNLKGTFLCARAAVTAMRSHGRGGRIVNISSGTAVLPVAASAAYAASKAGIIAFTRVLATEIAGDNITANVVAPGLAYTAQLRGYYSDEDLKQYATRVPLGRIGAPEEFAPAVVFLCSDGAAYITGQTLHVNGGLVMP